MRKNREIPSFVYDPSCVLYLPLWKRDGTTFISDDASGYSCTVTGATWGMQGRTFDGSDDYIDAGTGIVWNTLTAFSFSFWLKQTTVRTRVIPVSAGYPPWQYDLLDDSTLGVEILVDSVYRAFSPSPMPIPVANRWTHYAFTYNLVSGTWVHYQDGIAYGTGTQTGTSLTGTDNFFIGANTALTAAYIPIGSIGEVCVFNRALTSIEIQNIYLSTRWRYQ